MVVGYIGTYTKDESKGIYRFELNETTGFLSKPSLFYEVQNARYLAYNNNTLFAVCEIDLKAGIIALDKNGSLIDSYEFEDSGSCYLTIENNRLYTANFHEGTVSVLSFENNKFSLIKKTEIKKGAGAHQVLFYNDRILVPCRNLDEVVALNSNFEISSTINFAKHSGPRHGVFSEDKKLCYFVGEFSNEIFIISLTDSKNSNLEYKHILKKSLLKDEKINLEGTAAVRLSKNGKTIWASTRGEDCISVVTLEEKNRIEDVAVYSCEGKHPRDILPVCNEQFLLVANKDTNNLVSFAIQGNVLKKINAINIPEGICIAMEES